jgi:hypothetical protein
LVVERGVRPLAIVVLPPSLDHGEPAEPGLIQALIPNRPMKLSANAFWIGLPGWMKRSRTPVRANQARSAGR